MKSVEHKCKCGRAARFDIVKATGTISADAGDEIDCDVWLCGKCGNKNIAPVIYELKQAG